VVSLWAARLAPLHAKVMPKPESPIAPLTRKVLQDTFPGGRANPRSVVMLGYKEIERTRQELLSANQTLQTVATAPDQLNPTDRLIAAFKLLWQNEFQQTQKNVSRFRQFSSLEIVSFLRTTLTGLGVSVKPKLLSSATYRDLSFSFIDADQQTIGVIWTEEPKPNMGSFYQVMRSALRVEESQKCKTLYLIRAGSIGNPKNRGHQLCKQIFYTALNRHIKPDLNSLCHLVTYDRLARSAKTEDLLLLDQVVAIEQLRSMVRETEVLNACRLLQELGVVERLEQENSEGITEEVFNTKLEQFILDFMTHHQLASQRTIVQHTCTQFVGVTEDQVLANIQQLCQAKRFTIIDRSQPALEQIVCRIPSQAAS
jgi:hypothetical protein